MMNILKLMKWPELQNGNVVYFTVSPMGKIVYGLINNVYQVQFK